MESALIHALPILIHGVGFRLHILIHAFFSKLRNVNPLENDYSDYQKLLSSGLNPEQALSKMKLFKPPPSGEEN